MGVPPTGTKRRINLRQKGGSSWGVLDLISLVKGASERAQILNDF